MQRRAGPDTVYRVSLRPTASFGYQPFIDFHDELAAAGAGGLSATALAERMRAKGWRKPRGGQLTTEIMRIDLVSMCKHGFVERLTD